MYIYKKRKSDITINKNNYSRNIRQAKTTQAIRTNKFNFINSKFDDDYPVPTNLPICNHKISTVCNYGSGYWSHSSINKSNEYPYRSNFNKINKNNTIRTLGCDTILDFNGTYIFDLCSNKNIYSSNNNIDMDSSSIEFYSNEEYFEIFIYSKSNANTYIHIRYRVPIEYRYSYNDWTYWNSLIIDGTLSETEFVKIVNCKTGEIELS